MCGISGIVAPHMPRRQVAETLTKMTASLRHRGPDDSGMFATDGVGLGMRRLSVIDVDGGRQPLSNEDGTIQVVCNGEIYNYRELRSQLIGRGHTFRTQSDVEVIVHLYEDKGLDFVDQLFGMFAIAILDSRRQRLVLARDRLGKKPLFVAQHGESLLFGSEIKAILAADPSLAEEDPGALVPYLRFGFVPGERTMFRRIRKLPAATVGVFQLGQQELTVQPYWQLEYPETVDHRKPINQWVEELDQLLLECVRCRLNSDVPLGVFLSGGVDSSAIVAYASRNGLSPLRTFTVGFESGQWDESSDAAIVAKRFGTDHRVLTLSEAKLRRDLPSTVRALVNQFDEPFGDTSALPTYFVSKLAREHVTVILSGDGGDELFAGYTTYQGIKFAERYGQLPPWLGRRLLPSIAERMAYVLPGQQRYGMLRVARVLRDSSLSFSQSYFNKCTICDDAFLTGLLSEDLAAEANREHNLSYPSDVAAVINSNLPAISKMSYADIRMYLLDDMLVKVDRMSMAHSLEVRSPLLDHRLVEFSAAVPPQLKLRGWQTKAILRKTLRHQVPGRVLRKRKRGFNLPLRDWLRTNLDAMVGDYLSSAVRNRSNGVFNRAFVDRLLNQHRQGRADHSSKLWLLLNYAVWRESMSQFDSVTSTGVH